MAFERDDLELGCLWEKTNARGTYFSGTIGDQRVVVFRNDNKTSEKAPDWRVLKAKPKEPTEKPF